MIRKIEKILFDSPKYRIVESCLVGYEPRFELYEKRKFLFLNWWHLVSWSMTLERANEIMNKNVVTAAEIEDAARAERIKNG